MADKKQNLNLDSLFLAALEIESPQQRAAFLAQSCGDNASLQSEVEQLLRSHQQAQGLLDQPAPELDAALLPSPAGQEQAAALEAGLAAAVPANFALVIGDANHSVLKAMEKTIDVPRVVLREEAQSDLIVRPKSPEMPDRNTDSRYQLQGEIARGGMGAILKGRDTDLGRDLAIKVLLEEHKHKPDVLQRFIEEAQIGGQLQHPGIAPVYELGQFADRRPFFSMKLVKGETLARLLNDREHLSEERGKLLGIFEQVCQTMAYAHSRGVIHRDLKPANVLMTRDDVPKITDFGLAKELEQDQQLSEDGTVLGTPAYMSPEQARGARDVGPLTDVYGLGALFYCLLTGRPPFQGAKPTDTLLQVIHNEPVEPIKLQPGIPQDLETICLKCLQKDPAQRYTSAEHLADDLGRFLRGEPIEARPVGRLERFWRWCKRNPTIAVASGLAAVLALIVMIGGPISAAVIYGQKQEVVAAKDDAEFNATLARQQADKATAARQIADRNAEAAAVQERNALDALRSMTFKVQARMVGKTDLVDLREELLQTVREGLERMDDNENQVRERTMLTAGIHVRLGDINLEIGRADEAYEQYRKCLEVFEALRETEGVPYPEANWSKIYHLLGDAARALGDFRHAEDYHRQALDIRRRWADQSPSVSSLTMLALSLGKIGSLAQATGDLSVARTTMEEAVTIRQRLLKAQRTAENFNELLGARLVLAKTIFQQGETERGIEQVREVADTMRQHAERNPDSDGAKHNSAMFDSETAVMQLYVGQVEAARENFQRAADVLEALFVRHPFDMQIQEELEDALYGLLVARREGGQSGSEAIVERLIALRRRAVEHDPESLAKQTRLLVALARCGRLVEANQLAGELAGRVAPDDPLNYSLACAYAQMAAAGSAAAEADAEPLSELPSTEEFQHAALEALNKFLAAGFSKPTDLRLDPDLDPLRELAAFEALPHTSGR